ncbi:MAG: ABC transporter ATP-binding protein [Flavobacteriales bacterium]|nr:ABC transporter ATP-binding protein [Flavobacteriales bacterium]
MMALAHLNKYFWKYKWRFLLGIIFVVISNVFSLVPARMVREGFNTVSKAIEHFQTNALRADVGDLQKTLLTYGLIVIGTALAQGIFMFFMRQTIIVMSRFIEFDLKNEIFQQYQALTIAFYKRNSTGDLMNRISEDVSQVRMYIGPAIMYSINVLSQLILVIGSMLFVNVELTIYALLPMPILSVAIYYVSKEINVRSEQVQRQLSNLSTFVQENFSGIRILKSYARERSSAQDFDKEALEYRDRSLDLVKVNALFFPLMILLIGLSTLLTIYIGGRLAIEGTITTGNIAEFVIYVNMLTWPVASLGWVTSIVQRAAASQKRINEFLHLEPEIRNPTLEDTPILGAISFKDVSFTYPDSGIKALSNINFNIAPGQSLAIVGKTGSGKSTVAHLIGRLYDPTSGEIRIDERPLENINLKNLRSSIGYVPQEGYLFSDTIARNIAFGLDEYDHERIEQAAQDADVLHNILDFPKQFETRVGERGVILSGGQKQRVSIARAIIVNPTILIFDDCLSAVDTQTEETILQNLKRVMKDRTTVIISHRVSSVKHADQIIVLSNGSIIERGDHQSLLEQKGYYADLYEQQLLEEQESSSANRS